MIRVTWDEIKDLSVQTKTPLRYVLRNSVYIITLENWAWCKINQSDATEFEADFKPTANQPFNFSKDEDGAQIVNPKFAGSGRGYNSLHLEARIGVAGSLYCKDRNGADLPYVIMWTEKADGSVITDPSDISLAEVTKIILSPTFDYDIQGFCLYQTSRPTTDVRMWAVLAPFAPVEYGGQKEVITGLNLKLSPYDKTFMDYVGDSATPVKYLGAGSNEQMLVFRHPQATDHKIMGELFWYV